MLFTALAGGFLAAQTVSNDAAFRRVSGRLKCQCSCPYLVSSCNMVDCNSATYIRKTIQASLSAGKSEDAIVADFVQQYGERILAEPPRSGFWLSAWVMPFFVLLLGGALVSYILWQWKFKYQTVEGEASPEPSASDRDAQSPDKRSLELVEKYRAQIDDELQKE